MHVKITKKYHLGLNQPYSSYQSSTKIQKLKSQSWKKNVKMMHRNQFLISWHFIWSWKKFLLMEASMIRRYFLLIFISTSFMNMSFILARIPQIFQIYGWVFNWILLSEFLNNQKVIYSFSLELLINDQLLIMCFDKFCICPNCNYIQ